MFPFGPLDVLLIFGVIGVWICLRLSQFLGRYFEQLRRDPTEWRRFVLSMRMAEEARDQRRREVIRYIRSRNVHLGILLAAVLLLVISLHVAGGC